MPPKEVLDDLRDRINTAKPGGALEEIFDFSELRHKEDSRMSVVMTDGYSMSVPCRRGHREASPAMKRETPPQLVATPSLQPLPLPAPPPPLPPAPFATSLPPLHDKPLLPGHCLRKPPRGDAHMHDTTSSFSASAGYNYLFDHTFAIDDSTPFSRFLTTNFWTSSSSSSNLIPPYRRVIAIDTGCKNIVTACELLPQRDKDGRLVVRVYVLTCNEWRDSARANEVLKLTGNWTTTLRQGNIGDEKAGAFVRLAAPDVCPKTTDPDQYLRHMQLFAEVKQEIFAITLNPQWARLRFRTWVRKRRALWSFFAKLNAGRIEDHTASVQPMYAYGDAIFSPSGRGRMSVPTVAVYDALVGVAGKDAVCYVDEFRTSMKCFCCGHTLTNVVRGVDEVYSLEALSKIEQCASEEEKDKMKQSLQRNLTYTVRGVRLCQFCSAFVDRDVNAALNILSAFHTTDQGEDRPMHLRRLTGDAKKAEQKLKQKTKKGPRFVLGKIIFYHDKEEMEEEEEEEDGGEGEEGWEPMTGGRRGGRRSSRGRRDVPVSTTDAAFDDIWGSDSSNSSSDLAINGGGLGNGIRVIRG